MTVGRGKTLLDATRRFVALKWITFSLSLFCYLRTSHTKILFVYYIINFKLRWSRANIDSRENFHLVEIDMSVKALLVSDDASTYKAPAYRLELSGNKLVLID